MDFSQIWFVVNSDLALKMYKGSWGEVDQFGGEGESWDPWREAPPVPPA